MKKLFVLAMLLLAGRLLLAQVPYVRVEDRQTKYEQLTRQAGVQCRITDYEIPTQYTQLFHDTEISVRTVDVGGTPRYFYRFYRKEVKEQPAVEVFVAYDDFVEIDKALESMIAEEHKDRSARKDYCENFYRTNDGFVVGYSIKNRLTSWYLVLDRYNEDKVVFDSGTKLKDHFKKVLAKFEEVKKKNGN